MNSFDKVLIDAPCSGEGMFRKDNKLIRAWEQNGPKVYSAIQKSIILHGARYAFVLVGNASLFNMYIFKA